MLFVCPIAISPPNSTSLTIKEAPNSISLTSLRRKGMLMQRERECGEVVYLDSKRYCIWPVHILRASVH